MRSSWLVLVMVLSTACLVSSPETPHVRQALELSPLQVTVTDFSGGTFEGGVERRALRLAVSPPASGVSPERVDSLDVPRAGHAAAVARGFIYVLGGDGLASTARARLDDAAVGPFIAQTPLPAPRANAAATSLGDRLFLAGGSGAADVWHAPVGADGSLGAWASTTPLPQPLEQHAMVAARGRLYVLGGVGATGPSAQTWRAELQPDGTISAWVPDTSLPFPRAGAGVVLLGDRIVVLGGSSQLNPRVDVADVVSARIEADGRLGAFRTERPLPLREAPDTTTPASLSLRTERSMTSEQSSGSLPNHFAAESTYGPSVPRSPHEKPTMAPSRPESGTAVWLTVRVLFFPELTRLEMKAFDFHSWCSGAGSRAATKSCSSSSGCQSTRLASGFTSAFVTTRARWPSMEAPSPAMMAMSDDASPAPPMREMLHGAAKNSVVMATTMVPIIGCTNEKTPPTSQPPTTRSSVVVSARPTHRQGVSSFATAIVTPSGPSRSRERRASRATSGR